MVQANVDRILEVLRQKNTATVSELSRKLGLKSEDIEKSAEYLEEDGVIKLEHKFPSTYLHLVNDPGQDVQEGPDFKEENIASEKNPQS